MPESLAIPLVLASKAFKPFVEIAFLYIYIFFSKISR